MSIDPRARELRQAIISTANHYDVLLGTAMVMFESDRRRAERLTPARRAKIRAEKDAAIAALRAELAVVRSTPQ